MKRTISTMGLAALLCGLSAAMPALASGGSATGGGSVSGGGTGGGSTKPVVPVAPTLSTVVLMGTTYYLVGTGMPTGTVTFGYTPDNSYRSIDMTVGNLSYPDGTVLPIYMVMTRPIPIYPGTSTSTSTGSVIVSGGAAQLSISTANGDIVPDFPNPTAGGTTTFYVLNLNGGALLSGTLTQSNAKHTVGGA